MDQARRIALGAQGFADPPPQGAVDRRHFRRVMHRMSALQLDSVNVFVRSHYLPVFARLGPYNLDRLDDHAYSSGEWFEYWGHVASLLPVETYPMLRYRMEANRPWRSISTLLDEHPGYVDQLLDEIAQHGPLSVSDLADPGGRTGPWWGYGRGKLALEWLFMTGAITTSHRRNFTRYYDLPERVLPDRVLRAEPLSKVDAHREMIRLAARSHGIGTDADLADYFRITLTEARPRIAELLASGELEQVEVAGWSAPAYLDPAARLPRAIHGGTFLSPFDPVVWHRDRAERLFGFHYRIEIYVPKPKRIHGYYVLPFLLDGEIVGRADLKSDRQTSRLLVRGSFVEPNRDPMRVAGAMAEQLATMAGWLGMDEVAVDDNGDLSDALRQAL